MSTKLCGAITGLNSAKSIFAVYFFCFFMMDSASQAKAAESAKVLETTITPGGKAVEVWKPESARKLPLIVYSHGFGGNRTRFLSLMNDLAAAGYIVVSTDHKDANAKETKQRPEESFVKGRKWTDQTYMDRHDDIVNMLSALHSDPTLNPKIDWSKVGMCGHSLGGYTALGLAGAWPSWKDKQIKAIIALSPYSTPYIYHGSLETMNVPVLFEGGTKDSFVTPWTKMKKVGTYARSSSPAYFVDFDGLNHLSWTNLNKDPASQKAISYYCVAFFDKYLKGIDDGRLARKLPGVTELDCK